MISLPWPDKVLHPNSRGHWAPKAKATKAARSLAYWTAHLGMPDIQDWPIPLLITFHPPDNRRRDTDGMLTACKAYLDGIADAWYVDDSRFVPTLARGEPVRGGCVIVALGS